MAPTAKIDPELLEQLHAAAEGEALQAVVSVRGRKADIPGAAETQRLVDQILERVSSATGERPSRFNIFRNLGSFVVEASPAFLESLLDQKEVAGAVPNRSARTVAAR